MYKVAISRVQAKVNIKRVYYFTKVDDSGNRLYCYDDYKQRATRLENARINFSGAITIQVKESLYGLVHAVARQTWTKYSDLRSSPIQITPQAAPLKVRWYPVLSNFKN